MDKNQLVFKHSSRKLPLNNSMYALSVGFPGREKSSVTLAWYAHRSSAFEMNSGPLSRKIREGSPFVDVKILVDHPSREIVYYVDAGAGRSSLRPLQLSFAMIADHGPEQLEEILDAHRVIERMAEAGSEPVAISNDELD